ncbi:SLC13 family permease [Limibacter armeniacum]|uniref:SLC13 family permease n=1 Tax=Limibacter armeniacum TaxID=466084 RepID=UPI002FE6600A
MNIKKAVAFIAGPFAFITVSLLELPGLSSEGQAVLASTIWVGIWWMTEAVELEVTSLLPILLLPLSGAMKIGEVTTSYGQSYIFLFMGGFIIGLAVEKCGLHKRIAFSIIHFIGTGPKKVVLGFMIATGFLSMWISNTATAIMMLPIALSLSGEGHDKFSTHLLLGIAYAASIGGMATLIGTPPNIIFAAVMKNSVGVEIPFVNWMLFAFPFSFILIIACWWYLTRSFISNQDISLVIPEKPRQMDIAQKRVSLIFGLVALLWIIRSFLLSKLIPGIDDTVIAMFGGLILFIIPSGKSRETLMDWKTAKTLPWGILLMFGGGLAIAKGFSTTDLATWLAGWFRELDFLPVILITLTVVASTNFLTEMTSNTATASMLLPLLITLSASLNMPPVILMSGAVLASSCAFMLPVATPPNAVVFSSGKIKIQQMIHTGFWLNIVSIVLILLFSTYVGPMLLSIE